MYPAILLAGTIGAALVVAAGLEGVDVLDLSKSLVTTDCTYTPDPSTKEAYEHNYQVFRRLLNV